MVWNIDFSNSRPFAAYFEVFSVIWTCELTTVAPPEGFIVFFSPLYSHESSSLRSFYWPVEVPSVYYMCPIVVILSYVRLGDVHLLTWAKLNKLFKSTSWSTDPSNYWTLANVHNNLYVYGQFFNSVTVMFMCLYCVSYLARHSLRTTPSVRVS